MDDLKTLYKDGHWSDTELRSSAQTFQALKAILSARSPVFRSLFSSDMRKKNSGHVDIPDFESDTIHRMLRYMYTDSLEDLQFDSAFELYKISDKYQISSLKSRCASFLKDCLCPSNACDILNEADLHSDDDLKGVVQDYILSQNKKKILSRMEIFPENSCYIRFRCPVPKDAPRLIWNHHDSRKSVMPLSLS